MGGVKHWPADGFQSSLWILWEEMLLNDSIGKVAGRCIYIYIYTSHAYMRANPETQSILSSNSAAAAAGLSSHTMSLVVTFPHCSSFPQCSLCFRFQSANQSPAQFTSDFNLASIAMLILTASWSSGQMQRKKRVERQRQWGTAVLLVSLNLSKVLCQVFPVQPCIPFTSLKVWQKKWIHRWRNKEAKRGSKDRTKGKNKTIYLRSAKIKNGENGKEELRWDLVCSSLSNSLKYWSNSSLCRETVAVLRMRGTNTSTSSSI